MNYSELLKDPRWQKKRLHILERDGWRCRRCENKDESLHIHHLKYSKYPWDAEDVNLFTLCKNCHSEYEYGFKPQNNHLMFFCFLNDVDTFFIYRLGDLSEKRKDLIYSILNDLHIADSRKKE